MATEFVGTCLPYDGCGESMLCFCSAGSWLAVCSGVFVNMSFFILFKMFYNNAYSADKAKAKTNRKSD
jgi:hypothetical protein